MRVWDLPTGALIDWFAFEKSATSLSISPSGEYLATTHVGNPGIFLWSNRTYFSRVLLHSPGDQPRKMQMPRVVGEEVLNESKEEEDMITSEPEDKIDREENNLQENINSLDSKLITLSNLPASRWQNLSMLDAIKVLKTKLFFFFLICCSFIFFFFFLEKK